MQRLGQPFGHSPSGSIVQRQGPTHRSIPVDTARSSDFKLFGSSRSRVSPVCLLVTSTISSFLAWFSRCKNATYVNSKKKPCFGELSKNVALNGIDIEQSKNANRHKSILRHFLGKLPNPRIPCHLIF